MCARFPDSPIITFLDRVEAYVKFKYWIVWKTCQSVSWSTFALLASDLSSGQSYLLFEQLGSDVLNKLT